MNVKLQKIAFEDKPVLRRLLELYQHDSAEFDGADVDEHGLYGYKYLDHYWTEDGREAYFVRVDEKLAGFVMTRPLPSTIGVPTRSVCEFFVMRKYRRLGVGRTVATRVFDMHPGRWHVHQFEGNEPSKEFWRSIIADYTNGNYEEIRLPDSDGPTQVLDTPGSKSEAK